MAFTQRQIMLCLAYLAYTDDLLTSGTPSLDAQIKTDLEAALSAVATSPLPPVAGQWSVVWGPVTYTVPGALYQDNMMYVAQATTATGAPPQYAVAIRGTNGSVPLDWLLEDLDVFTTMPWPLGSSGPSAVGNITEAESIDLTIILSMVDPVSSQTLIEFLASAMTNATATANVCVTGHSLGAALAAGLALFLRDMQPWWDPQSVSIVTTVTFAGPGAIDASLASYFADQFAYTGTSPLSCWTPPDALSPSYADIVRTSLDLAPLAWNTGTMKMIPHLYEGHGIHDILPPLGTTEIINLVTGIIGKFNYTQFQPSQPSLRGTFVEKSKLPPNLGKDAFFAEVAYQHHYSYPNVLGVPQLLDGLTGTALFSGGNGEQQ